MHDRDDAHDDMHDGQLHHVTQHYQNHYVDQHLHVHYNHHDNLSYHHSYNQNHYHDRALVNQDHHSNYEQFLQLDHDGQQVSRMNKCYTWYRDFFTIKKRLLVYKSKLQFTVELK